MKTIDVPTNAMYNGSGRFYNANFFFFGKNNLKTITNVL